MLKTFALNSLKKAIVKTKCYHLKLFYFSLYCLLCVGCGKKIQQDTTQQEVSQPRLEAQVIELKAKLLKSGSSIDEEHTFTTDSEVRIPEVIEVTAGNAGNQLARIYFNFNDQSQKFDFYCNYIGGASTESPVTGDDIKNGELYYFDNCYAEEGEITYLPGDNSIQDKDKAIVFKLISADPRYDTEAAAQFEIIPH